MEKAIQILADCQRQGNDYLTRKADDFARWERRLSELRASGAAAPAIRESENALTQLHQPLRDIFEKQLKPRLERIPTAAQRSAAAAAAAAPTRDPARPPATQPAKSDRP